jgi:hypothetical protein
MRETPGIANATPERDEHDDIEITPEMVEAGVDTYFSCEWRRGDEERVVAEVYKAMWRIQKGGP